MGWRSGLGPRHPPGGFRRTSRDKPDNTLSAAGRTFPFVEVTVMSNVIDWFEIPVVDFERAVRFYEALLGTRLRREAGDGPAQALFVNDKGGADGAVILDPRRRPSADGSLVYLRAPGGVDSCLERAAAAGGRVVLPTTDIGDPGFIAIIADTEGNHVGLHVERAEARP